MKLKARAKFLFLAAAAVLLTALFACALLCFPRLGANAEQLEGSRMSLALPASYEQYLDLRSPSSVAMSDDFIVIADGNKLYIYDRAAKSYTEYEHFDYEEPAVPRVISKVQIFETEGRDRIFFSDVAPFLFEYADGSEQILNNIPCQTFLIDSATAALYTANTASGTETIHVRRYTISETGVVSGVGSEAVDGRFPNLTLEGNTLYCSLDNGDVAAFTADTLTWNGQFLRIDKTKRQIANLKSICAYHGELYYTVNGAASDYPNGLYKSVNEDAAEVLPGDGFSALTVYRDELYGIVGRSIRKIALGEEGASFADYEIAAASDSPNRLSGASDIARAGNLIVAADRGNRRVSVITFGRKDGVNELLSYATIPCLYGETQYTPKLIATDGNIVAVSDDTGFLYLYRADGEFLYRHDLAGTPATGLACVYGNTYFVTEHAYGKAEEGSVSVERSGHGTNVSLASDLYGDLYVVYNDGTVGKFSESDFLDNSVAAQKLDFKIPNTTCVRADFAGNLYHLEGNTLYKNGAPLSTLPTGSYVYGDASAPLSVAIGFEDDVCYFLYGNYIVATANDAIDIPTLNEISAEGIPTAVFAKHAESDLLVDIPAGTIGIRTDLQALRDAEDPQYFPYDSYYRTDADKRGILLATKDEYSLVILYEENKTFTCTLFRAHAPVPLESYWTEQTEEKFLSNNVSAYYFPCLHPALKDLPLQRGIRVRVRGIVAAPEREYALVQFETGAETSAVQTGFVPVAYLTDVNPASDAAAEYEYAYIRANEEGIRFVADDGEELLVTERTRARLEDEGEGTYRAQVEYEGKTYFAHVDEKMIDRGESDALRISLIVILSVLAVLIVGAYAYLVPRKYYRERRSRKQT